MGYASFALLSALFAAVTAVLAKLGVAGVPSHLATALRTGVVVVFACGIAILTGEHRALATISHRSLVWLGLSGLGTGASWLFYFRALQLGPASRVAPLDKLSLALTVVLSALVLGEHVTLRVGAGVVLMVAGALLTL